MCQWLTNCTSPNAPRPMTFTTWKSPAFIWQLSITLLGFSSERQLNKRQDLSFKSCQKQISQQLNFKTHIFEGSFRRFCCVWGQGSHNHRPTIESRPGKRNKVIKILSNLTVWQFNWASIDSPKALRYTVHSEDLGRNAQDFLASVAHPSYLQTQALVIPTQSNPHQAEITPFPTSKI